MSSPETAPPSETVTPDGPVQRSYAEDLDREDPLAPFRSQFTIPDESVVYLDGNSLGRLPATTVERLARVTAYEWGDRLIRSWEENWLQLPIDVGDRLGRVCLGSPAGHTILCDNVTTNIFKLLHAALDLRPGRSVIAANRMDFPTDRYVATQVAQSRGGTVGWIGPIDPDAPTPVDPMRARDVVKVVHDKTAAVLLSLVDYRTAAIAEATEITAAAHDAGAIMIWDCSHAVGALDLDLPTLGADFAVGCSYKYLNGGPGAPAWIWVRDPDALPAPALPGWLGDADPFAMAAGYTPAPGVRRFITGTPSPLGAAAVDEGLAVIERAGMAAIRAKGKSLTSLAVALTQEWLLPLGFQLGSPIDAERRGSHVTVHHTDALALTQALSDRGILPDYRNPDGIRLGLSPLITRHTDVYDGIGALRAIAAALQS